MNHKELQMLVSSFLDGEIGETDKEKVIMHLKDCTKCRQFVDQAKYMREEIRSLGEVELTNAFAMRVAHSVERRDEQAAEWLGIEPLARNMFIALAVVVLIMFIMTGFSNNSSAFSGEQLLGEMNVDSAATHVLLQQEGLSKSDLLYAVMAK